MAELGLTENQKAAIEACDDNILLSAGAGSGKTFTLTERIIKLIKEDESTSLSRFLVVTFTDAAAAELRSRIAAELQKTITLNPTKRLTAQISQLETAQISTMHSFFKNSLLPYHTDDRVKLPPNFGILDETEASVLRLQAMRDAVNELYEEGDAQFISLADTLTKPRRESGLEETLIDIYASLQRRSITIDMLINKLSEVAGAENILSTDFYSALRKYISYIYDYFNTAFSNAESDIYSDPDTEGMRNVFQEAKDYIPRLNIADYETFRSFIRNAEFTGKYYNKKKSPVATEFKKVFEQFKAAIASLRDYFVDEQDLVKAAATRTISLFEGLKTVFTKFSIYYTELKRDLGKADFTDLEKLCEVIFVNEDGTPTEKARDIGEKYDYIFIDEYQDTSLSQDRIFSAIATAGRCKRFTVGDVKQSIYGFRGARPDVFVNYRARYQSGEGRAIFMSDNFRCDQIIIDFTNIVSEYIFSDGSTPFEEDDRLKFKKNDGKSGYFETILTDVDEYEMVANRVAELLNDGKLDNGEKIKPSDIAILMRSSNGAEKIEEALRRHNVPVLNSVSQDIFSYGEVLLLLCFLNAVDNPLRDVYITGALKSPMFDFSLNEIVKIRGKDKNPVWFSIKKYIENGEDSVIREKLKGFVEKIDKLRVAARRLDALEITNMILVETGFLSYSGDESSNRSSIDIANSTKKILKYAASIAGNGGGLSELITLLNTLIEKKEGEHFAKSEDNVNLLTIHKSKGLEFPVVFIVNCKSKVSRTDSSSFVVDDDCNAAIMLYDDNGLVCGKTALHDVINLNNMLTSISEEARVLYVAMTRAREKLFMSAKYTHNKDTALNERSRPSSYDVLSLPYSVIRSNSYMDWLFAAMEKAEMPGFIKNVYSSDDSEEPVKHYYNVSSIDEEIKEELKEYFESANGYSNELSYLYKIPQKLSVSALKPDTLNIAGVEDGSLDLPPVVNDEKMPVPDFMSNFTNVKGTDIGTATHVFMQFTDWEKLYKFGAVAEKERLVENEFMSKDDAALVSMEEIEKFRSSSLLARMLEAKKIIKERRFNALLPASDFTTNEELKAKLTADNTMITVQGVIDCLFYDKDDKLVLIDYKTDRLSESEKKDKSLAAEKLLPRHSRQLMLYSKICENILGRKFDEIYIYSVPLGDTIEVKPEG